MNSPRFTRFTPSQHSGEIHVRADAVVAVSPDSIHGLIKAPNETGSVIHVYGNGLVYVKESPSQVIAALRAAENTHYVTVEYVMEDGDTSSLADDCDYALALREAQDDAKIADERAEWYRKRVEQLLDARASSLMAFNRVSVERDSLLAKLKDTTAALEKANAELDAARYGKFWSGDVWSRNGFVGNATGTDPGAKMY